MRVRKVEPFCLRCGKPMSWTGDQRYKKYCSFKCSRNLKDKNCLGCGKLLTWTKRQLKRNYCSDECAYSRRKRTPEEIEMLRKIGSIGGIRSSMLQNKRSKGEILLSQLLSANGFKVETSVWTLVKGHEIDIYLPDHNVAISYNGTVHREPIYGQGRLNQIKNRDAYRDRKLNEAGIKHIVVNDIGKFRKYKVREQYDWCVKQIVL